MLFVNFGFKHVGSDMLSYTTDPQRVHVLVLMRQLSNPSGLNDRLLRTSTCMIAQISKERSKVHQTIMKLGLN